MCAEEEETGDGTLVLGYDDKMMLSGSTLVLKEDSLVYDSKVAPEHVKSSSMIETKVSQHPPESSRTGQRILRKVKIDVNKNKVSLNVDENGA